MTDTTPTLAEELAAHLKQHGILNRDTPLGDLLRRIHAALSTRPSSALGEELIDAFERHDNRVAECPIDRGDVPGTCPKCNATSNDSCWLTDRSAIELISDFRTALANYLPALSRPSDAPAPSADFAAGVEAARPLFSFKRYVNGVEMADGICIEKESTLDRAINRAVALCPARHGVTVLVLDAIPTPAPASADFAAGVEAAAKCAEDRWALMAGTQEQHAEREYHGKSIAAAIRAIKAGGTDD